MFMEKEGSEEDLTDGLNSYGKRILGDTLTFASGNREG